MRKYIAGWLLPVLALCLFLSACDKTDYKKALRLEEAGDYAVAAEIFEQLGDYSDAKAHLAQCRGNVSYQEAVDAQARGDYARAAELFTSLGSFSDAETRLAECGAMVDATRAFNSAAEELERKNATLERLIAETRDLISSDVMVPDEKLTASMLQYLEQAQERISDVPPMPDTAQGMAEAVDTMSTVNYDEDVNRLRKFLDDGLEKYQRVTAPTEDYILSCMMRVPGISMIAPGIEGAVNRSDFDKNGPFYSCVFFDFDGVELSQQDTVSVEEVYQDNAGQVEAYSSVEAAKSKLNAPLNSQDPSAGSGYSVLYGTVIVRVSDALGEAEQKELVQSIFAELTNLDS